MSPRKFTRLVSLVLLAGVASLVLSSCGGGGGQSPSDEVVITPPPENRAPVIEQIFEDITLTLEAGRTVQWESAAIGTHFSDPDDDALKYRATSSNAGSVHITFNPGGPTLVVRALSAGSATVTVTAEDPGGLAASQSFTVTISEPTPPPENRAPVIERRFEDITLTLEPGRTVQWESPAIETHFSDPDDDALRYRATSSNSGVADTVFSQDGSTLIVRAVGTGSATVTLIAEDPSGLAASQSFTVTVNEAAPPPVDHSDTPGGATNLVAGQAVEGRIDPSADVDYFRLRVSEPGAVTVTLTAEPGVEVALLDTAGNILAVAVTASEATVTRELEKGDYFVRVRDREGAANETPYRLVPTFVEAPRLKGNASLTVVVVRGDSGGIVIALTDIIEDPAGGRLTFSIQTTDFPDALGVVLSNQNLRLVAKENAASSYSVTVTATNDQGASREFRFEAKVRSLPRWKEGVSPPPIVAVNASGGRTTVVLADYVEDPDDGPLEFSDPRGQLPAGVTAALTGNSLVIAAQPGATAGRHTLAVTATNVDGLSADFSFEVIVEPFPERIQNGPSLPTLVVGGETTIRLTLYRGSAWGHADVHARPPPGRLSRDEERSGMDDRGTVQCRARRLRLCRDRNHGERSVDGHRVQVSGREAPRQLETRRERRLPHLVPDPHKSCDIHTLWILRSPMRSSERREYGPLAVLL